MDPKLANGLQKVLWKVHNSKAVVVLHHDFPTGKKKDALGMISVGSKERAAEMDVTAHNPISAGHYF